jgi:Rrf2 family protein
LARSDPATPVPCKKLASAGEMPERFLLQILRMLVTHGILRSTRGVEGGYSLLKSPDEISLLEVIEAIDGPMAKEASPDDGDAEGATSSALQSALFQVTQTARRQLQAIKLSQLLEPPTSLAPKSRASAVSP